MQLDFNITVTIPDWVRDLAERYLVVLERMNPPRAVDPTRAPIVPLEPLAPVADGGGHDVVDAPAPPAAPVAVKRKRVISLEGLERIRAGARKRWGREPVEAALPPLPEPSPPLLPPAGSAAPAIIRPVAPPLVRPPAPVAASGLTPLAVPLANVIVWAAARGIEVHSWDDLPKVNAKRTELGLVLYERETRAA